MAQAMEPTAMNDAELTILSLLAESPRYGHELQRVIDERGLRDWIAIGFSSIYYILNKLEKQRMVEGELRQSGSGPARKRYQLTDAGRGVLQTAIAELLRQPRVLGTGFELGLVHLNVLKPHMVFQTLSHHQSDLQQRLTTVESAWQRQSSDDKLDENIRALYTHSIAMMKAELTWLDSFLKEWLERYPGANRRPDAPATAPVASTGSAVTQLARRTTPDPAKLIQKLRRPPRPDETPKAPLPDSSDSPDSPAG